MVPEEAEEGTDAILVGFDDKQKGLWAMSVEAKGPTDSSTALLSGKVEDSGYNGVSITMKSDQGADIVLLKKAVSIKRQAETTMVESPVRASKANGQIERAIKTWQGQFRTLRLQLEDRIGCKLSKGSPLMSWLVNFAADVLCRHKVHDNGLTNYEMVTGHRFKQATCGFAEKVHYKINTDKNQKSKMETEWGIGYYLGCKSRTLEHLISTEHGIIKCETFKRMPDDVAYDKARIEAVTIGYREYVCKGALSKIPAARASDPLPRNPDLSAPVTVARRTRITPVDLAAHGYTPGCPGCEAVQLGHSQRTNHTEACRKRLEEAMAESEAGKERLQKTKERMDFRTAQVGRS